MPNPITFPGLGLSFTIDRVAFTIGSKPVYWYGIIICIGFLLGAAYACRIARRYGLTSEQIQDMLAIMGAHSQYFAFQNVRFQKELKGEANRLANCDSNNIDRTVKTAQTQIEDIEFIDEHLGIEKLPPPIKEIANLRLMEPNASLAELGEMCSPPIGKSGVNNRIRRLTEIARTLREGKP